MSQDRLTRQQRRQVRELIKAHNPLIQAAFIEAIENAKGQVDFEALIAAVRTNDIQRAFDLLRLNQAILWPLEEAIRSAIIAGGRAVTLPRGLRGSFSFSGRHPRAEEIIRRSGARLVTEIGNPGHEAIQSVMLLGRERGEGVQAVAERLAGKLDRRSGKRKGGILGLDGPRAERSARVRAILSDPERISEYFRGGSARFKSTDRRFDGMVRKAIDEGRALNPASVERIVKLHDARLLRARGKTIAEHESYSAQAQGRREAYAQLLDSGRVESVDKRWDHNTRENFRPDHLAMDGERIGFHERFVMDDGTAMLMPHDPDAPALHTLGCKCSVVYIPQFRRPRR